MFLALPYFSLPLQPNCLYSIKAQKLNDKVLIAKYSVHFFCPHLTGPLEMLAFHGFQSTTFS